MYNFFVVKRNYMTFLRIILHTWEICLFAVGNAELSNKMVSYVRSANVHGLISSETGTSHDRGGR
jgi:hypothetical protein